MQRAAPPAVDARELDGADAIAVCSFLGHAPMQYLANECIQLGARLPRGFRHRGKGYLHADPAAPA